MAAILGAIAEQVIAGVAIEVVGTVVTKITEGGETVASSAGQAELDKAKDTFFNVAKGALNFANPLGGLLQFDASGEEPTDPEDKSFIDLVGEELARSAAAKLKETVKEAAAEKKTVDKAWEEAYVTALNQAFDNAVNIVMSPKEEDADDTTAESALDSVAGKPIISKEQVALSKPKRLRNSQNQLANFTRASGKSEQLSIIININFSY